jgi:hypothetical protein
MWGTSRTSIHAAASFFIGSTAGILRCRDAATGGMAGAYATAALLWLLFQWMHPAAQPRQKACSRYMGLVEIGPHACWPR